MVGIVVHMSPVLVVGVGIQLIFKQQLTIGELTQFLLYLAMFYFPLQRMSDLSVVIANAVAAIERIFEFFDTHPNVTEAENPITITQCKGRIEFDRVSFCYDANNTVLNDISFTLSEGEVVAFVGPSGSGKSTLANLIPRFYDPTEGIIRLDDHDIRELKLSSLRQQIGIVSQDIVLFSGTVLENLTLARADATLDEIYTALDAANAREFVEQLPDGLGTEIGERGATLSGGQKQRLAIARAFIKSPKILILDEATSALDSRSEQHIQEALARLLKLQTSVVIAHRLSTVVDADRIIVLEHGKIKEIGTHAELIKNSGLYANLFNEQFKNIRKH
jgi:subfamily B ATP-binding cassette protein MsbA